jgi:membrane protease YdiL (CAAX protease family)
MRKRVATLLSIYVLFGYMKGAILPSVSGMAFWLFDFFSFVVLPLFLFLVIGKGIWPTFSEDNAREASLRGNWGTLIFWTALAWVGTFAVFGIFFKIGVRLAVAHPEILPPLYQYQERLPESQPLRYVAISYFALTAGVVEELFYRAYFKRLVDLWFGGSRFLFVCLSTLVFGFAHWPLGLPTVIGALAYGGLASSLYLACRDIRPLMLGHSLYLLGRYM